MFPDDRRDAAGVPDRGYDVRVLEGEMPAKGGPVSLFIDIIGMPLTPVSYAGGARRTCRRAFHY